MWDQLGLFSGPDNPSTVSEVTGQIRALLTGEPSFQDLWMEGEVSNFSRASSGHCYFTLKDAGAQISGVIWRSQASRLHYLPQAGDQVVAHGKIGLYEASGRYQFYVDRLRPAGRGSLAVAFERLKARLAAEGLFAEERKRPLPAFPQRIGVVTSPIAAALRDVLNVLRRRYPQAEVLFAPTQVQGDAAPLQIVAALRALNAQPDVDLILRVRGGGSLEDLWAFNDERVARAVAASRLPIISGVGHETDFSLSDFAADLRAPTPSAAAELATPDRVELRATITQQEEWLQRAVDAALSRRRGEVAQLARALHHLSPVIRLGNARQRIDGLAQRAATALAHRLDGERQQVTALFGRLAALNPEAVLRRGYAIVRERETGKLLTSVGAAPAGLGLNIQLRDGEIGAVVE